MKRRKQYRLNYGSSSPPCQSRSDASVLISVLLSPPTVPVSSAVTSWGIDCHTMLIKFLLPSVIILYFTCDAFGYKTCSDCDQRPNWGRKCHKRYQFTSAVNCDGVHYDIAATVSRRIIIGQLQHYPRAATQRFCRKIQVRHPSSKGYKEPCIGI